jgi:hypothetical protein
MGSGLAQKRFRLVADVSTDDPAALRPVLVRLVGAGHLSGRSDGFHVECERVGNNAKDLNRALLSELRRIVKKTRLRAEWTAGGMIERFFDYVSKGIRYRTVQGPEFKRSGRDHRT